MNYEETYKQAFKKALDLYNQGLINPALEHIFPELKENKNNDEYIRQRIIHALRGDVLDMEETIKAIAWLEKQGEKRPIINVPTREVILSIWDLGNEWKELTNGSISTEYGTQLDYIQKHWHESEYYLKANQDEKKELKEIEFVTLDGYNILSSLGNNQVQDILEDMGMLDDNGRCPHTAEEIFKAGMEYAFDLNRQADSSVKLDSNKISNNID